MPRRPTGRIRDPTDPKAPRAPDAEGSGTRHDLVRRALSNDSTLRSLSVHYAADPLNLFLRQLHRLPNVRGFIEERPYPRWVVERATHGPREGRSLGELAEWRALTQQWHRIEREGDAYAESSAFWDWYATVVEEIGEPWAVSAVALTAGLIVGLMVATAGIAGEAGAATASVLARAGWSAPAIWAGAAASEGFVGAVGTIPVSISGQLVLTGDVESAQVWHDARTAGVAFGAFGLGRLSVRAISGRAVRVQGGTGPRTVVAGAIPDAVKPPQHVLFDTDAVRYLQGYVNRGAALPKGVLNAGEAAALPETVVEQLARQTARGKLAPRIASDLPVVPDGQSALLRSDVARTMREFSVKYGRLEGDVAADAAIGGTALERGLPLVTGDTDLHRALQALGVDARLLRMITR